MRRSQPTRVLQKLQVAQMLRKQQALHKLPSKTKRIVSNKLKLPSMRIILIKLSRSQSCHKSLSLKNKKQRAKKT